MTTARHTPGRRALLLALVTTALAGCAGPELSSSGPPTAADGKGVAIVSVTNNEETGRQATAIFYVDGAHISTRRLLRSEESALGIPMPSDFKEDYGQLYALVLPAGPHEISGWLVSTNALNLSPRVPPAPLTFSVRAGETIYLGNLHMNIMMGRGGLGLPVPEEAIPEVRDRADIDLPLAQQKYRIDPGKIVPALLPLGPWQAGGAHAASDAPALDAASKPRQ